MREISSNQKKVSKIRRLPPKIRRSLGKCRRFWETIPLNPCFPLL